MERLIIQLPRGRTAMIEFDPSTEAVRTKHAGLLGTLFKNGVADFQGQMRYPADGTAFLVAVYDHLFLAGYSVRWCRAIGIPSPTARPSEETS